MAAPLTASATTVGTLLSGSTFEIPAYQREYAWRETEVSEFWDDLSNSLSRGPYFLGLIILTGEEKRKQVVDGQQRLLTVTLLASAIRHEAIDIGRKALADRIHSTLLRSMDYTTDEVLPRIVLTDNRANGSLQAIIEGEDDDEPTVVPGSSSDRLWKAYRYLRERLMTDGSDIFRQLGAWAEFIQEQLYVAVFEHPDEASAYSVFEVVNTRGKDLTTADLLKNYVLRFTPPDSRDGRYRQWQQMVTQFEQVGNQHFVQYIRHVLILQAGYILPKELYNYIARRGEYSNLSPFSVDDLMDALQAELSLYLQLIDPTTDGPADGTALGIFVALNELGVTAVRPLMLAISSTEGANSGMLQVLRLIVRRMVVGNLGAGSVEKKFAEAAHIVRTSGSWQEGVETLREMDHRSDEFISALERRSYNRGVLTFIRRSIVIESMTPPSVGTLQYLRPRQTTNDLWPEFNDEEVTFWGSTLGNSLLVNLDRRPRGANTWAGVKQHLFPHAIQGDNVHMLEQYDVWTPAGVAEVGLKLAQVAARVWY
jgi:hypothetical protein